MQLTNSRCALVGYTENNHAGGEQNNPTPPQYRAKGPNCGWKSASTLANLINNHAPRQLAELPNASAQARRSRNPAESDA